EERAVPAVVLEHKQAHHHHRAQRGQEQRQPVADAETPVQQQPRRHEEARRRGELPDALPGDGVTIRREEGVPVGALGHPAKIIGAVAGEGRVEGGGWSRRYSPPSVLHPPSSILHPPPSTLHPPPSVLHPPSGQDTVNV